MPKSKSQNKNKRYSDKQISYISDLYHIHGMSIIDIAKKFKRTEDGIRYALQKRDLNCCLF